MTLFESNSGFNELAGLVALVLSGIGLTAIIVWPQDGPGAFVRERLLRPLIPGKLKDVLDCYICFGFWAGLIVSVPHWWWHRAPWTVFGCLMVPAVFWVMLHRHTPETQKALDSQRPNESTNDLSMSNQALPSGKNEEEEMP